MLKRLGLASLMLALVAGLVPVILAAAPPSPLVEDAKGAAEADPAQPAIPATSQLGMLIMVLLVMTASTSALLGGGIFGGGQRERAAVSAPARDDPGAEEAAVRGKGSPKQRAKRAFASQRGSQAQARQGWNVSRRGTTHAKLRRRGGPGCRGVR